MSNLLICDDVVLVPRREDVEHDFTTISMYPDYVAVECTCGFHAPPVGLAENPMAHVEYCEYRTNRLRNIKDISQPLLVG